MTSLLTSGKEAKEPVGPSEDSVVEAVLEEIERRIAQSRLPEATYRLQVNHTFTFRDVQAIVPYLAALGISDCYMSPYVKARANTPHGYDIVDHNQLNPEIGTGADFESLVAELKSHDMGQVVDVVPNHMGVGTGENAWWLDVLENGPGSPYASFFDIDWAPVKPDLANKVLLPILGDQYGKVLEDQQLVLAFEDGAFVLRYFDRTLPIEPRSWELILKHRAEELTQLLGADSPQMLEYLSILTAISHLPGPTETDSEKVDERRREKEVLKRRLSELSQGSPQVREFIEQNLAIFNGRRGDPHSFDLLDQLLLAQCYRLAYWRVAAEEINYRRFFDINDMAAICMEKREVFDKAHELLVRLLGDEQVQGLRIDHPDGLCDPSEYLFRLQETRFLQLCREAFDNLSPESSDESGPERTTRAATRAPSPLAPFREEDGNKVDVGRPARELSPPPEEGPGVRAPVSSSTPHPNGHSTTAGESTTDESHTESTDAWEALRPQLAARFRALRSDWENQATSRPIYVVVEKILEPGERVPENWPVFGTTGYEFLNTINGLFVDAARAQSFSALYAKFCPGLADYTEQVYRCKRLIMRATMSGEINMLGHQLDRISERNRRSRDFTLNSLTDALREVIAWFPVYRTYVTPGSILERDRRYIDHAVARAKRRNAATSASVFDFVRDVLLLSDLDQADEETKAAMEHFVGRFQQVTGPIMAKSVEDTAFYLYNRLVSLNEVGGDPQRFGTTVAAFHQQNIHRQDHWSHSLLATSTHDTKRSEDVRARINVLSEMPKEFRTRLFRWARHNQSKKRTVDDEPAPSRNDEYLLYQTLLGSWPVEPMDEGHFNGYRERIQQYMQKATREAKARSSWISPNEAYEKATHDFVAAILNCSRRNTFLADFEPFARRIADLGIWNSLSQTLLKLTCPGVPDFYQGTELWDDSLVDPDNRRPVDYERRRQLLQSLVDRVGPLKEELPPLTRELIAERNDGRIKLYVIWRMLEFRRAHPNLCTNGGYIPIDTLGARRDHVCAFGRKTEDSTIVIAVPRLVVGLGAAPDRPPIGFDIWSDTELVVPQPLCAARFRNVFTGELIEASGLSPEGANGSSSCKLPMATVLGNFPVAVLECMD